MTYSEVRSEMEKWGEKIKDGFAGWTSLAGYGRPSYRGTKLKGPLNESRHRGADSGLLQRCDLIVVRY